MARTLKPAPKTVAIATANDTFSVEVGQGAADYANAHGMQVVYQNKYPADTTDVSAVVSAIKALNPDMILNGGHLDEALLLHRRSRSRTSTRRSSVFGRSRHAGLPQDAGQRCQLGVRRHAVVADGEV